MLTDFITQSGKTRTQISAELGISRGYLSGLESRKKVPSLDLAVRIERLTSGAVPAGSWLSEADQ